MSLQKTFTAVAATGLFGLTLVAANDCLSTSLHETTAALAVMKHVRTTEKKSVMVDKSKELSEIPALCNAFSRTIDAEEVTLSDSRIFLVCTQKGGKAEIVSLK